MADQKLLGETIDDDNFVSLFLVYDNKTSFERVAC